MNDTLDPVIAHADGKDASTVKPTGSPDEAAAATSYVGPRTTAAAGAVDVKVIACDMRSCTSARKYTRPAAASVLASLFELEGGGLATTVEGGRYGIPRR